MFSLHITSLRLSLTPTRFFPRSEFAVNVGSTDHVANRSLATCTEISEADRLDSRSSASERLASATHLPTDVLRFDIRTSAITFRFHLANP